MISLFGLRSAQVQDTMEYCRHRPTILSVLVERCACPLYGPPNARTPVRWDSSTQGTSICDYGQGRHGQLGQVTTSFPLDYRDAPGWGY